MGKLTVIIDDELERRLRRYVTRMYPVKPFGKLSLIVSQAIEEYLNKQKKESHQRMGRITA